MQTNGQKSLDDRTEMSTTLPLGVNHCMYQYQSAINFSMKFQAVAEITANNFR